MARKTSEIRYKILIVGDSGVGKTSILYRFKDDTFDQGILKTIGIDFTKKEVYVDNKSVCLQIWDTAGQERFRSITQSYYRGAKGILVVFSLSNLKSFNSLDDWMRNIRDEVDENIPIVIVGNKSDEAREVDKTLFENKAKEYKMKIFFTSAKDGDNINEVFLYIAKKLLNSNGNETKKKYKLGNLSFKKKNCC